MQFEKFQELKKSIMQDVMEDGGITEESLLEHIINDYLVDSKRIDHEDVTIGHFDQTIDRRRCKINGYMFNTTEERLQLFIIDEDSYPDDKLRFVTKADEYGIKLKTAYNFIRKVFLRHFYSGDDPLIENVPDNLTKAFITNLGTSDGVNGVDTVEIFLISLNMTVRKNSHGGINLRDDMEFNLVDNIKFPINLNGEKIEKNIAVKYSLVDLNFLYRIHTSVNGREPIKIKLDQKDALDFIEVANEEDFKSYLTALPGNFLVNIYKDYSSRLLERNIRAFLDFKSTKDNVNSGMKRTIIESPHKFVAYNNGLTITCNKVEIQNIEGKDKIVGFEDFQIVNGGQTTASIYFTATQKYDVSLIKVMAKINMIAPHTEEASETEKIFHNEQFDNFVADISNYSNAQNKVNKVDLRSNEPVLQKIKALSNTISTPSGAKWFYEKSRGELGAVKRKNELTVAKLNANYPKNRRFQNTELAKYYESWGQIPYKIKKGGESVFFEFIEDLKGFGLSKINKSFYENLIGRAILFRDLEKLHGSGKNAIGQLRAAVIPYSISCIYIYANSLSKNGVNYTLNFETIWKDETISKTLADLFLDLMKRMYLWIDKYKSSTDISENTKKEDLWNKISKSSELKEFLKGSTSFLNKIIVEHTIREDNFFDFSALAENVKYHSKGYGYYKKLRQLYFKDLSYEEKDTLDKILDNYIIKPELISQIISGYGLNKNLKASIDEKKSKTAQEKILNQEIEKKQSMMLKQHYIQFLDQVEDKVMKIDLQRWDELVSFKLEINEFKDLLEDVNTAFNDNDFGKLKTKATLLLQQKKIGLKYQVEYLSCLRDFNKMPTMVDLYQLLPIYRGV